tara:strand:+ start:152 stop:442 length:291 start_codon:yes stop_codon:yes gene_type:complete
MKKSLELNQEILRKRLIEIYKTYAKSKGNSKSLTEIKEIVAQYDDVRELLHDTLNMALGILEAISNKEIKDKKEEEELIKNITKELNEKNYLGSPE